MLINIYVSMPSKNINTDKFPILDSIERVEEFLKLRMKDNIITMCIRHTLVKENNNRIALLMKIEELIPEDKKEYFKKNPKELQIKFYLVTPMSGVFLIGDFAKVMDNLKVIENKDKQTIIDEDRSKKVTLEQRRDMCLTELNKEHTTQEALEYITRLAYVYEIIDDYVDEHMTDIQSKLYADIRSVREEAEKVIINELDMVNDAVARVLKGEKKEINILKCTYNNEEISKDEMIGRLVSHVLPEYVTQINIQETLDDEYRIDTEDLVIVRSKGGGLKVSKKN